MFFGVRIDSSKSGFNSKFLHDGAIFMMIKQFNFWKKSLVLIVCHFSLPLALTAQNLQLSSKSSMTELGNQASNQPGNILLSQNLTGNLRMLFILVKYPGNSSGILSFSQAQQHASELANAISINSYNTTSITVDITPTLTMPNSESFYGSNPLVRLRADAVNLAEQAGFDLDSYDREVIFSKKVWGGAFAFGTMNKRTLFMSHSLAYVTAHELGHSSGWRHANFWEVNGGSPISSNGTEIEYGDKYDLMGGSSGSPPFTPNDYHHFNPWFKYRGGWLPDENILEVTNSGTYTIQAIESDPMSSPVTKYTALKIRKDPLTDYWVFFRSQEEFINYGAIITQIQNDNIRPTLLLDMTPGSQSNDWRDAALAVGQTFSDTLAGISVTVLSVSASEVQVNVTVDANALASMDNLPIMDVISPTPGVTMKGVVDYEVTAFDPDFGNFNGAGIASVKLFLHQSKDALIVNMRAGLDPPSPVATIELFTPPYRWQFDTNSGSPVLQDATYYLIPRATSIDGGTYTVWYEHIIDNFGMPVTPALSAPADNAAGLSTTPTLSWNTSSGATSYRLQVSTDVNFSSTVVDQSGLLTTSFQVMGLSNGTTYYWRVNATNSTGTSDWSSVWQFSTAGGGSPPAAPALSSPVDNTVNLPINPTLVWNASSGATSYRLQVSTVSNFSTTVVDQTGLTATSLQVSGLSNSTTYYWRVNAANAGGTSPWSTAWQFTTVVAGPAAPTLSSPADNATGISTSLTLVWNASGGATSYRLQVSAISNFSTLEVDQSGLTATSLQVTGLSNSTTHYWRVKATNAGGTSPWSAVWQFTTMVAGPAIPSLSSPGDNATDVATNPTLVWNAADRATTYQLQVSTSSNFSTAVVDQGGITATSFQVTGLLNNTTYFWRVRAGNAGGTSDWSGVRQFTTRVAAPAAPVLSSPADNATNISIDTTLIWSAPSGATTYRLQLSTVSDFSMTAIDQGGLSATSFQVSGLANETRYYWRVNASNAGGTSPWSTVWKFTTEKVTSVETGDELPEAFRLNQNYPNPFNPTTNIAFELPEATYVLLTVYSVLGEEIATLVSGNLQAGKHSVQFDGSGLASGVYLYQLKTRSFVQIKKMLMVR